jgi:hypothetical protein
MASRSGPSKCPTASAWSKLGGYRLHGPHSCAGLWDNDSGDSKGLPHRGQTGPWSGAKSIQQTEQKKGMPELPTGPLQ